MYFSRKPKPIIRELRSDTYTKVIEVSAPIRFYWGEAGYDGVELGPFKRHLTHEEKELMTELLGLLNPVGFKPGKPNVKVPDAFNQAFQNPEDCFQ